MSEVKRYWVPNGTLADQSGWHQDDSEVVQAWAFDRVTAERDVLQAELAQANRQLAACADQIEEQQQRLIAADEREDVLEGLLRNLDDAWNSHDGRVLFGKLMHRVEAELKPAEGGGAHAKHYECIGKGGDYTVVAIAQGAGTLKGFNHYVYKNADGVHFVRDPEDFLSRMQIKL